MLNMDSYSNSMVLNQSQEFRGGDIVEENSYAIPMEEDNQSMHCIQLVFKEAILDERQELEAGAGKEYQNIMMETDMKPLVWMPRSASSYDYKEDEH